MAVLGRTVIGGAAVRLIFRGGLAEITRLAEPAHRAAVVSAFFAAAYADLGLPPVLTGQPSQLAGAVDASAYTSGIVGLIVVAAMVIVLRTFGVQRPSQPPDRPATAGAAQPNQLTPPSLGCPAA